MVKKASKKDSAGEGTKSIVDSPQYASAVRLHELQGDLMKAKGIVASAIDSLAADAAADHPMYALRAAEDILDRLFNQMDPAIFWRDAEATIQEAKEVAA